MRNILKLGLISAITAIALAQTPSAIQTQGMDEDVLAIASRGALSDKMQGFRKLADDEAGSIVGGLDYNVGLVRQYGYADRYNFLAYYYADYPLKLTPNEMSGKRLNIGAGESFSDYNTFTNLTRSFGGLYLRLEVNFQTNRTRQFVVNSRGQVINNAFTERLLNFSRIYYLNQFGTDRVQFTRPRGYY